MTIQSPPPKPQPPEPRTLLRGLERAAGEINPFLVILALGIAILDFTCYAGLVGSRHMLSLRPAQAHAAAPAQSQADMSNWAGR
jgi:hypothetical protein